jgi:hypothetical protein
MVLLAWGKDHPTTISPRLYDHLVSHHTRIVTGIRDADHGVRGIVFADPDGRRIGVGQNL